MLDSAIAVFRRVPRRYIPYVLALLLVASYTSAQSWLAREREWHDSVTNAVADFKADYRPFRTETAKSIEEITARLDRLEQRQLDFLSVFYRQIGRMDKAKETDDAKQALDDKSARK